MGARGKLPKAKIPTTDVPCSVAKPSKAQSEQERRWRAEDGLRAIQRAEEIRSNPQTMSDIKQLAQEQMSNLKKFAK